MSAIPGKAILVVEDEALVAMMLEDILIELGARVVGPAATLRAGLELARSAPLDAAVLDVNLNGERADPIAAALAERGVPMVFTTGYGRCDLTERLAAPAVEKPYSADEIAGHLERLLSAAPGPR